MNALAKILIAAVFLIVCFSVVSINILPFYWVTSQAFYFRFLMILAIPIFAVLLFYGRYLKLKVSLITLSFSVFLLSLLVSNILSENSYLSFWGNLERMSGYFYLLLLFFFFLLLSLVINAEKLYRNIFYVSIIVSIPVVIYGLLQWIGYLDIYFPATDLKRVHSFFGNPSFLAVYILLHIFILIFCYFRFLSGDEEFLKQYKNFALYRLLVFASILIGYIFILFMTGTRGTILSLFFSLIFLVFLKILYSFGFSFKKIFVFCLITVLFLVFASFFFLKLGSLVKSPISATVEKKTSVSRIVSYSIFERSSQNRLFMWEIAWNSFKDNPFFGSGQESFESAVEKYYQPKMASLEYWVDRPHNIFWDTFHTSGAFGMLFFLLFLISVFYSIWMVSNKFSVSEKMILSSFIVAYMLNNMFLFETLEGHIPLFLVLSYISYHASRDVDFQKIKNFWKASIILLLAVFSIYLFAQNAKSFAAARYLLKGFNMELSDTRKSIEFYKKAISIDSFVQREAIIHSFNSSIPYYKSSLDSDSLAEYEDYILMYAYDNFHKFDKDYRYYFTLGTALGELGFYNESMDHLNRALEIFPQRERIKFMISHYLIKMGEYDKAFQVAEEVFDLNSNYWQNRSVYARSAIYAGQSQLADEILPTVFGFGRLRDLDLLRAYMHANQNEKVIELVEGLEDKRGALEAGFYFILIDAYYLSGDTSKAIEVIDRFVEIYPDYLNSAIQVKNLMKKGVYSVSY